MPIDLTSPESLVTSSGALKLNDAEVAYLQSFLDRGDRGGYYMALYNMTGNAQCIEQAQISTFSEGAGGVAYVANYLLQTSLAPGEYPGIYFLSQEVAKFSLLHGAHLPHLSLCVELDPAGSHEHWVCHRGQPHRARARGDRRWTARSAGELLRYPGAGGFHRAPAHRRKAA